MGVISKMEVLFYENGSLFRENGSFVLGKWQGFLKISQ